MQTVEMAFGAFEALPVPGPIALVLAVLGSTWFALFLTRAILREWLQLYAFARWHFVCRRKGPDRRIAQRPFEGPERRSGHDRRSLVPAA